MMKKKIQIAIITVCLFLLSPSSLAFAAQWKVDQAHSGIYFGINHIYSTVKGFFPEFKGDIFFDPENLGASKVFFKVSVKSVNTNNGKRDNHLLSNEFFDEKKYPEMTFESNAVTHKKNDRYVAKGILKIKDVSKPIELPFTFFGTKPNPFNPKQEVAGFEARMTIDRLEYNVGNGKFFKMGVVGKDVDILVSLEANRKK